MRIFIIILFLFSLRAEAQLDENQLTAIANEKLSSCHCELFLNCYSPTNIWNLATEEFLISYINNENIHSEARLQAYLTLAENTVHQHDTTIALISKNEAVIHNKIDKQKLAFVLSDVFNQELFLHRWEQNFIFERLVLALSDYSIPFFYPYLEHHSLIDNPCRHERFYINGQFQTYRSRADYAAFYLSQITKIPLLGHKDHSERVTEIPAFKIKIQAYCAERGIALE